MPARKPLSKRRRFEVFHRDGFTCQYCGATPPGVVLHVDHIVPVAEGGDNQDANLLTACEDCNLGKGVTQLHDQPETVIQRTERLREKEEQVQAYNDLLATIRERQESDVNDVEDAFMARFPGYQFTDSFRRSVTTFLDRLPKETVIWAMDLSANRMTRADRCLSYFCGVCWKKIRGDD
jgi:hypothetical protein